MTKSYNEKLLDRLEADYEKNIVKAYKKARGNIKKEISVMLEKGIDTQTELMRYDRLNKLNKKITKEIAEVTKVTVKELDKTVKTGYIDSSNREYFNIENQAGIKLKFNLMNTAAAKEAVKNPLDLVGYVQREKNNMMLLVNQLNSTIATGIIQGKGYRDIANGINERIDIGFNKSLRIAVTETHRVIEKASQDRAEEAYNSGLKITRKWLATLDGRTRDEHGAADGQEVGINDPFTVGGESLMYPGDPAGSAWNTINCRCSVEIITPNLKSDYERLTYEEWIKLKK